MSRIFTAAAFAAAIFVVSGCAVDFNNLVPTATLVALPGPNGESYVIQTCGPATIDKYAAVPSQIGFAATTLPPQIGGDAVVRAIVAHAQYVSDQALRAANAILISPNPVVAETPVIPKPATSLAAMHFHNFATMVSEKVLRHTSATPTTSPDQSAESAFWSMVVSYYYKYYRGSFTPYMGATLAAPTLSSTSSASTAYTVSDTEIVNAVSVFVELLLDDIFQSPVWKGTTNSNGKPTLEYYPSGSTTEPTSVALNNLKSLGTLSTSLSGCGMNIPKANFVRYLANAFSDAANADTSLAVKSAGGIDVGFGILGKLSIGDNKTLTDLVQMAVSEAVARFTVAFAVPIVSSIDISQQSNTTAIPKSSSAYPVSILSRLFVSNNS